MTQKSWSKEKLFLIQSLQWELVTNLAVKLVLSVILDIN